MIEQVLPQDFYKQDAVSLARGLLGKIIVKKENNHKTYFIITETEAYFGEEDKACHCSKGKTQRTYPMYEEGGTIYIYLIYGMYWMLNIVSGSKNHPQAVLIRGIAEIDRQGNIIKNYDGPGKAGRILDITKEKYNCKKIYDPNNGIYIIEPELKFNFFTEKTRRVGINYAGEPWISKLWRFIAKNITVIR